MAALIEVKHLAWSPVPSHTAALWAVCVASPGRASSSYYSRSLRNFCNSWFLGLFDAEERSQDSYPLMLLYFDMTGPSSKAYEH